MVLPNKDDSTVYFITDKPYIFVGSQRYGVDAISGSITELAYDPESMILSYRDGDDKVNTLELGPASATKNGMLSKTDYIEFQKLRTALDGIVHVKSYVDSKVNNLGASISYGEVQNNKRPLHLKNSDGVILSTVWTDIETYLANSISRAATTEDVILAAQAGVALEEGDKIIILSLTNGNKHYIKLQDLIVSQSFKSSKTIKFTDTNGTISADVNLADNKIIYVTEEGLTANIQIKRDGNFIKLFGQSLNESHLIGKFLSPKKELLSGMFISNISEEHIANYPPSFVNWKADESIVLGNDYYILLYQDYLTESIQYYYISIAKPTVRIANIEGNLLKADENGDLYVLFEWIDQTT